MATYHIHNHVAILTYVGVTIPLVLITIITKIIIDNASLYKHHIYGIIYYI